MRKAINLFLINVLTYQLDVPQLEVKMDFVALVNKDISYQDINASKISTETPDVMFLQITIIVYNVNLAIN